MAAISRRAPFIVLSGLVVAVTTGCSFGLSEDVARWDKTRIERQQRLADRDADMQREMKQGLFGSAQVLPDGSIDPRTLPPRPRFPLAQPVIRLEDEPEELPPVAELVPRIDVRRGASPGVAGIQDPPCVYKPVMTAADLAACR